MNSNYTDYTHGKVGVSQITMWDSPDAEIKTTAGTVSYRDWCREQAAKIGGKIRRSGGEIAVFGYARTAVN